MNNKFSIKETNTAKGFAVLLLLIHHLFYPSNWKLCTPFFKIEKVFIPSIANHSKVCVAIFLILSGYGLCKSLKKSEANSINFSAAHLVKLMLSYWFIYVIFVSLSFVLGNRNPTEIYGTGLKGVIKFLIDFCGLANDFGTPTMNATWWYMGTIIPLYCLFPVLYKITKSHGLELIISAFLIALIPVFISTSFSHRIFYWIFPFVLGIFLSEFNVIEKFLCKYKKSRRIIILILLTAVFVLIRFLINISIDGFFGISLILLSNELIAISKYFKKIFIFLGEHSANIFMMHTFVYSYFFKDFFYALKRPVLIYIFVLFSCIVISLLIEKAKDLIGFKKAQTKIQKFIYRSLS